MGEINVRILLPLFLGLLALSLFSTVPLYFLFPRWIGQVSQCLKQELFVIVQGNSRPIANAIEKRLQTEVNLQVIYRGLFERYEEGSLELVQGFTGKQNYENAAWYAAHVKKINFELSLWHLNGSKSELEDLSEMQKCQLFNSTVFDVMRKSINLNSDVREVYSGYADSFFYVFPAKSNDFFLEDKTDCNDPRGYDPVCRPWYKQTKERGRENDIVLVRPYRYVGNNVFGQAACNSIWKNGVLELVNCHDFSIDIYTGISLPKDTHIFLLNTNGTVFYHPRVEDDLEIPIVDLEFPINYQGRDDDVRKFEKEILPLFSRNASFVETYEKDGESLYSLCSAIGINPIFLIDNFSLEKKHRYSLGVVTNQSRLRNELHDLEVYVEDQLLLESLIYFTLIAVTVVIAA